MKLSVENKEVVIRIPSDILPFNYIQDLIDRFEFEELVKDVKMSEKEAWELSEKLKKQWWEKEGNKLIKDKNITL